MTKVNKWTLGLAAIGLVSLPAVVQAEEKPNQILTALSSTTLSGYVDTSMQWQIGPSAGQVANTPAYAFNTANKQNGFNLDVVNLVIEKPLDEGTWSAGYKVDLIFGPNAVGWNNSINNQSTGAGNAGNSDFGIKQAYVAMRVPVGNGIDLKVGSFDTIIGYEVFNSGSNPNYTRSWGYTIEPTQHTGVLGSYNFNKSIGVAFGIANTWSAGINQRSGVRESDLAWLASITLTAPEDWGFLSGSALYLGIVDGASLSGSSPDNSNASNDALGVTSFYAGATILSPWKSLKFGVSYDYANYNSNGSNPNGHSQAVGVYSSFQATEKLSLHLRGEWADIADAYATGGSYVNNDGDVVNGSGGIPSSVLALTGTVQYDLWANVLSRLEIRWDHALSGARPFGGTESGASSTYASGANEKNAFLIAGNFIYKF